MPVNLRPAEWRSEILSNFASWVTVWVRPLPGEDLSAVIERVGFSTRALKREKLGGLAVDLLELPDRLMIAAKRWLQYLKPLTGDVVVDTAARNVTRLGQPVGLTAREYALVELLAQHRGQLITRSMIYEHLFDETEDTLSNLVDVHVSNVRKKLGKDFITTRRGQGYVIDV